MLSHSLKSAVTHLLPKIYNHPFNIELSKGTLPKSAFRLFVEQDTFYLQKFSQTLFLTAKRCQHPNQQSMLTNIAIETIDTERNLQRKYLGSIAPNLFARKIIPANQMPVITSYTQHLLDHAANEPVEAAIASATSCFWVYDLLGKTMPFSSDNDYHLWLASYSNPQFRAATTSMVQLTEQLLSATDCPYIKKRMISGFVQSTQYEILFWDSIINSQECTHDIRQKTFKIT